jgi:hypothetical protein
MRRDLLFLTERFGRHRSRNRVAAAGVIGAGEDFNDVHARTMEGLNDIVDEDPVLFSLENRRIFNLLQHVYIGEFLEIIAPMQYAVVHVFGYYGWNRCNMRGFDVMTQDEFETGLMWMFIMVVSEVVTFLLLSNVFFRIIGIRAHDMVSFAPMANKEMLILTQCSMFTFVTSVIFYHAGISLDMSFPWLYGDPDSAGHMACVPKS